MPRGRVAGSKNKATIAKESGGNPDFNINAVEPSNTINAAAAVTDEDIQLDRELELISRNTEPAVSDQAPPEMKKSSEPYTLLSEFVEDYKPASTIHELEQQVFEAKSSDADSVECTEKLGRYFLKGQYNSILEKAGYFMYHDIKVYIQGHFEQSVARDKETTEFRNFGASKIV